MVGTVRARVKGGMLELLEKIDLPEGKEVSVTILETPTARGGDGLRRSAGAWKGLVDADKLIENIYADRLISTRPVPAYENSVSHRCRLGDPSSQRP